MTLIVQAETLAYMVILIILFSYPVEVHGTKHVQ